jgi:parvulin-like peptidyl-prolyl isomerase
MLIILVALCGWPHSVWAAPQAGAPQKAQSVPGDRVVLTIGDQKMTAAEVEKFIQALPSDYQAFYGGPGKHLLPQYLVQMKILTAEAIKEKLDEQPEVAYAIEIARESILVDAARKHLAQGVAVSDQELQEFYQKQKTQAEEVRVGRILIRTKEALFKSADPAHPGLAETEARKKLEDIRKQILAGADFAQMAKQYSDDAASAASGGDAGYIKRGQAIPVIVDAAYSLQPGQLSDILTTPYGLEIIKVEDRRTQPFEEAKPSLESQIRQSRANELIQRLMHQYRVAVDEDYFSSQPAKSPSPPSPPSH